MIDLESWPDHLLTIAEWDALPEDTSRHWELMDGVIMATPHAVAAHQLVTQELAVALDRALRPRWRAIMAIELTITEEYPPTVRVPDVVVLRAGAVSGRARIEPADVLAAAEVLWDGTRDTDHLAKPIEYAEVGIGCYLIVEPGPPTTMTELRLRGDAYERAAEHSGTAHLTLDGSDVVVDLAGMLEP